MTKLMLLEDEPVLRTEICAFLTACGHEVTCAGSVAEFMQRFRPQEQRIAVLDLGLPDGDGLELIARMRRNGLQLGVIVLTARTGVHNKVEGLTHGADYFISKSADLSELSATVSALERRLQGPRPQTQQQAWVLQSSPRQLIPPGHQPISLSTQDFLVLRAIIAGGESVSRAVIVEALGANYLDYDQRRLDTQMRRLRKKVLEACGEELPISTLRSVGFCFHAEAELKT